MLSSDKKILEKYATSKHLWVGIPSIEVTKGGRTFLTFYSGGVKEEIGNYVLLVKSDDGKSFSEPIAVCYEEGHRCYDPCLWLDPLGRLWLTWSRFPDDSLFAAICDNPDADEIVFGEEFFVGNNIMMNKPIVLQTGEWVFPIAVWNHGIGPIRPESIPRGSFAYVTYDNGKTFSRLGAADVKNRTFDEHMFLEMNSGVLRCFVRTTYGIGAADSYDGGLHWGTGFDTGYGGPCSRFHIRRLPSGRVLLINHYNFSDRNNLTAMLSEDDGKTFPYRLLLDERSNVSYPDATIDGDGMINITYDRERGAFLSCLDDVLASAREILTAKISEDDIINGSLVNNKSYLKNVAFKLTDYTGDLKNPFNEASLFENTEYAKHLKETYDTNDIIEKIFDVYPVNCSNIHNVEAKKLDELIKKYTSDNDIKTLNEIIALVRSAETKCIYNNEDVIHGICEYIIENLEGSITLEDIATKFHFSSHYIRHIFKKKTGVTIGDFKKSEQIKKAKLLLSTTNHRITDIAAACGFEGSGYFTESFVKYVGISPTGYRKLMLPK